MKWAGLTATVVALGIAGSSLALFAAERSAAGAGQAGTNDLPYLDRDLANRIGEMVKTMERVKQQVDRQVPKNPPTAQEILGNAEVRRPVAASAPTPVPAPIAAVAPAAAPEPPWWQGIRVTLISAGNSRYAVINNRLQREGDTLAEGWLVERIESGAVVLRHGDERQRIALNGHR